MQPASGGGTWGEFAISNSDTARDQRASAGYRADIDGLRALAVLPIVAFHLGFQSVPGGYVGVDVFFVISGYLIGGTILRERRDGRFSLARFYERRLRRILPALVAMLAITTLACLVVQFPRPLMDYARSLVAAMLSVSNILFWQQAGYFDTAAAAKPLLHTWSLGVEEQFYLLFPPLLLLLSRLRLPLRPALAGVALASLVLGIVGTAHFPTAAFYLIPSRAWELLLGTLCAGVQSAALARRGVREAMALVGAIAVLAAIRWFDPHLPFPGVAALLPCLGTAALLLAGAHGATVTGRLLSLRPVVFFGLISYSLYLWHWPLIVLTLDYLPAGYLSVPQRLVLLALSILLAWTSWRFVERPFRAPAVTRRFIFRGSAIATLGVCGVAAVLLLGAGLPARFAPQVVRAADSLDRPPPDHPCLIELFATPGTLPPAACVARDPRRPNLIVLGDSHADHLVSGLTRRWPDWHIRQLTAAGCRPTLAGASDATPTCRAFHAHVFGRLLAHEPPGIVVLAAFWGPESEAQVAITIDWLRAHGQRVILVGPVPRYTVPLPLALARSRQRQSPAPLRAARVPGTDQLDRELAAIARAHGAGYLSPFSALCPDDRCRAVDAAGEPVQYDTAHLTDAGSLLVARQLPQSPLAASPAR